MKLKALVKWFSLKRPRPSRLLKALAPFDVELVEQADLNSDEGNTALRAWKTGFVNSDATHILVCDDDAVICPKFEDAITGAILSRPNDILQLSANEDHFKNASQVANKMGCSWISQNVHCIGTALAMPKSHVANLIRFWCEEMKQEHIPGDLAVLLFAWAKNLTISIPIPTLIDEDATLVSTIDESHNRDHRFLPVAIDGSAIRWTRESAGLYCNVEQALRENRRYFRHDALTLKQWNMAD